MVDRGKNVHKSVLEPASSFGQYQVLVGGQNQPWTVEGQQHAKLKGWKCFRFPPTQRLGGGGSVDSPAGPEAGGTSGPVGVLLGQGAEKAG